MKKLLLGSVAVLLLAHALPASAADLAVRPYTKAPAPMVAAAYDWSGFYVGINGGYATSDKCWYSVNAALAEGCHSPDGGVIGGQIGYNWQFSNIVFGVEGSGDWANLTAGKASTVVPIVGLNSKIDAIYTATARVGVAWNNALLYVKGGGAWASDKYNETIIATNTLATISSETRSGYVVGVGGEYGFTPNLSAALEYDYIGMGTKTLAFVPAPGTAFTGFNERIGQNIQTVTARLNYRFGGPVIAKY